MSAISYNLVALNTTYGADVYNADVYNGSAATDTNTTPNPTPTPTTNTTTNTGQSGSLAQTGQSQFILEGAGLGLIIAGVAAFTVLRVKAMKRNKA